MNSRKMFVLLLVIALLGACSSINPSITQPAKPTIEASTHAQSVHWTYEGEEGPEHWGELSPAYNSCGEGTSQSPIDIDNAQPADVANLVMNYEPREFRISNNGHTVKADYKEGGYIEVDGQRYAVDQFHYHAPSEHTVGGQSFAAELHIVHLNADGDAKVVIGILLEAGAENPAYQPFLENLPAEQSDEIDTGVTINAADLLPSTQTTFRYSGSLTTPPCTQDISWLVMSTPVQLSTEQLARLTGIFEGNNRPIQPLNQRSVTEDITP